MAEHTIGQVAQRASVNVETVRFYERKGLVEQPPAPVDGGFRKYDDGVVSRILFIKRAQNLGFTLVEIGDLLALSETGACEDVRVKAEKKLVEVQEKIRDLQKVKRALNSVISSCNARGELDPCPILASLQGQKTRRKKSAAGVRR